MTNYGKITALVLKTLSGLGRPFSVEDVSCCLNGVSQKQIQNVFNRFVKSGKIKRISGGNGRTPAKYIFNILTEPDYSI